MSSKLYKMQIILLILSSFLLCQCTKAVSTENPTPIVHKESKKISSPYNMPSILYLTQAKTQAGPEQQSSLLKAAGRLVADGQWHKAVSILAQTHDLSVEQENEKNILLAKVAMMRDKPKEALLTLASIRGAESLSQYHQIQFHEMLAQSYRMQKRDIESISERIKLDHLLQDDDSLMKNRKTLWLTLSGLPQAELDTIAVEANNGPELQGWLQLAQIARKYRDNSQSLLAALDQWQAHFPNHPGNRVMPNPLDSIANKIHGEPQKIALLLPLSGALAGPGAAIRDGFMAAYNEDAAHKATKVQVYDTDKGSVAEIYQQAISDGAQYIVGPLSKSEVATVAQLPHPVPTLLLNDSEASLQDNSFSFGLSPANEAVQVAIKAHSKGYSRALIIAPKNAWGTEVAKAFTNKWQQQGGYVVDTFAYDANEDMNKGMRDFLHITGSEQREKKLKELLGQKLQVATNRRQDFDLVFLLAYPSKARQIMPLLKYYYAGDIPVYATSTVYSGSVNALKDKDLEGLIFCDMPWVFTHQMGSKNWPEQFNSYNRLYAVGMDSFALATQLNQLILFPSDVSDKTKGVFYMKQSQRVARKLEWGQFRQGLAQPLNG